METFEQDHTLFAGNNAGDERLFVKFENKAVLDKTATAEQGRPIHTEKPYIEIRAAGSTNYVKRLATVADMQRFPRHYAAFKNHEEMPVEGTLLSEWPVISRTVAKDLEALEVRTVEQLVNMSDLNSQNFLGINELKRKAKNFLEQAAGEAPMLKLQEELEERDVTIDRLSTLLESMEARVKELEGGKSKPAKAEKVEAPEPTTDADALAAALDASDDVEAAPTRRRRAVTK